MANRYAIETIFKAVDRITRPITRMRRSVADFARHTRRGIEQAAGATGLLTMKMVTAAGVIKGAFVAAVAGVSLFVVEVNKANSEIDRMSKSMGVQASLTRAMEQLIEPLGMTWENFTDLVEEQTNKIGELKGAGKMKKLQEALALTNIQVKKLVKSNPQEQFIMIADALIKLKDSQKAAFVADEIWGGEGNKIISTLRTQKKTMSQLIAEYQKYNFYSEEGEKASAKFLDSLKPLQTAFSSGKSQLAALTGEALIPYIEKAAEWIAKNKELIKSKIAEWATKLADALAWVVLNFDKILLWGARIGTIIGIFIALTTVLNTFVLIMTAVNLVMAASPFTWLVIGLVALAAIIAFAILRWEDFKAACAIVWEFIVNKFVAAFTWLKETLNNLGPVFVMVAAGIFAMFGPIGWLIGAAILIINAWDPIKAFFKGIVDWVVNNFDTIKSYIMSWIDWLTGKLSVLGLAWKAGKWLIDKVSSNKTEGNAAQSQAVGPTARQTSILTQSNTSTTAQVTLLDKTSEGRTQVTGNLGNNIKIQRSGA